MVKLFGTMKEVKGLLDSDIMIRKMEEEDKDQVITAMRRSFSVIARCFFSFSPNVLVGERNGEILGAVVLKTFKISANTKGGLIAWIFTVPEARGLGLGQALTEAGIEFFESVGCQEIFAAVEGYNSSSRKLFASRGFGIISPGRQFSRYGLKTLRLWLQTFHLVDVGHFLWMKPAPVKKDNPTLQLGGTIIVTSLIWLLILWRTSGKLNPLSWLAFSLATIVLFGIRYLGMWLAGKHQGLQVRYRAWESGFPVSIIVALLMGGPYLVPGGLYPLGNDWRYRDLFPQLSMMSLSGILSLLMMTTLTAISLNYNLIPRELTIWFNALLNVGLPLLFFDTCLPFFPFSCFNGRRVWEWNKLVWLILSLVVVSMLYFFV